MQQKMHFISIKNIKLCYLEFALTYFCIVNAIKIVWVVNCLAPILILKLNIRAYKQTKIFWQPKLMQLRRVCTLYFLNLACLSANNCFNKKVSCLEIQHDCPSGKVYAPDVGQSGLFWSFISVVSVYHGVWFIRKIQTVIEIKYPMTFHCKEQQFHNAFLIRKEHQLILMLV